MTSTPTLARSLIEEGAAFSTFQRTTNSRDDGRLLAEGSRREAFQVIVIGGGQAGLSVGYHLAKANLSFVILDANRRIGDAWRNRWDSLRLFTPAKFDGLDGMKFPAPPNSFPSKDDMADFLETYARRFRLPVRTSARVERVKRQGPGYVVWTDDGRVFTASSVVVAMGSYQHPDVPGLAADLDPEIVQLHSSAYRNLGQLRPGPVLIVGRGNSGAEIAREVVKAGHEVWLSGPDVGSVPVRPGSLWSRFALPAIFFAGKHILTMGTPIGRAMRSKIHGSATPLIRVKWRDLVALGVKRSARIAGTHDGRPLTEDGTVIDAANVIWSTGYTTDFAAWIDGVNFDKHGDPEHHYRGIVAGEPGLYFVGLAFLYAMSSEMVRGVGRDARHVVAEIGRRFQAQTATPAEVLGDR